jgi:DinB superfamily
MIKRDIPFLPVYFERYINQVPDIALAEALDVYGIRLIESEKTKLILLGDQVYSPGKWTIADIMQHIIDTERIFAYRALRIARNDQTPLPGFDENVYADQAHANDRNLDDLIDEFITVRRSTIQLFNSFKTDDMLRQGIASGNPISVVGLGYTIVGHVVHHMEVIKERYYPLIQTD